MVPSQSHPAYRELLVSPEPPAVNCLALKILLSRLRLQAKQDSSTAALAPQVASLHEFLVKNEKMAHADIERFFGRPA